MDSGCRGRYPLERDTAQLQISGLQIGRRDPYFQVNAISRHKAPKIVILFFFFFYTVKYYRTDLRMPFKALFVERE